MLFLLGLGESIKGKQCVVVFSLMTIMEAEKKQSGSLRGVAFVAIAFSTVAITACLLLFPMVLHYVQTLEAGVNQELDFCKGRTRELWGEMLDIHAQAGKHASTMIDRQFIRQQQPYIAEALRAKRQAYRSCCTCHRGESGPSGAPGVDGSDGIDGEDGRQGERGSPAPGNALDNYPTREQCPCEADQGEQGPKGQPGSGGRPGEPGQAGQPGKPGDQGPRGPPGQPGSNGTPGQKGPSGDAGVRRPGPPAASGRPGEGGRPGSPGAPGRPGSAGSAGRPGANGEQGPAGPRAQPGSNGRPGENGRQGNPGPDGSCDHCPPPRLAQGY